MDSRHRSGCRQGRGEIVVSGTFDELMASEKASQAHIYQVSRDPYLMTDRPRRGPIIVIRVQAEQSQDIDVKIPLGCMVAVPGWIGKSSLVTGTARNHNSRRAQTTPGTHDSIEGIEKIDKVIVIDQSPSGGPHVPTQPRIPRPSAISGNYSHRRPCEGEGMSRRSPSTWEAVGVRHARGPAHQARDELPDVWVTCDVCKARGTQGNIEVEWKERPSTTSYR